MSKFWIFICAVLDRWAVLVTGGMVTAVLAVLQAWLQKPISWRFYRWVFMVFVAAACFLAWREEYDRAQRLVEEKAVLQRQLGSPNIIIESPQEFTHRTENIMYVEIRIHNTGTPVENADFLFALLCCEKTEDILQNYSEVTFLPQHAHFPRIGQNHGYGVSRGIYDQEKTKFQSILGVDNDKRIFAYAILTYTKPFLLIGDKPEQVTDISSFGWDPNFGQWYVLNHKGRGQLQLFMDRKLEELRKDN